MAVTPVRTLSPWMRVWQPTSTPGTSVMALCGPGVPRYFRPTARARGLPVGVARCGSRSVVTRTRVTGRVPAASRGRRRPADVLLTSVARALRRDCGDVVVIEYDTWPRSLYANCVPPCGAVPKGWRVGCGAMAQLV